jgi:hypothetical protein
MLRSVVFGDTMGHLTDRKRAGITTVVTNSHTSGEEGIIRFEVKTNTIQYVQGTIFKINVAGVRTQVRYDLLSIAVDIAHEVDLEAFFDCVALVD